eukprot:GHUV01034027.1.p2 GENE.GHUV01034027.1~~GHUV01034027.1.p2  ORF type:complete len:148 (+),score=26.29 GHUV01034027.1:532-975(+)
MILVVPAVVITPAQHSQDYAAWTWQGRSCAARVTPGDCFTVLVYGSRVAEGVFDYFTHYDSLMVAAQETEAAMRAAVNKVMPSGERKMLGATCLKVVVLLAPSRQQNSCQRFRCYNGCHTLLCFHYKHAMPLLPYFCQNCRLYHGIQ